MSALPQRPAPLRMEAHDFDVAARRVLDVGVVLAGLICLAPLVALIALAIRLESRGPIFFSQVRLGQTMPA